MPVVLVLTKYEKNDDVHEEALRRVRAIKSEGKYQALYITNSKLPDEKSGVFDAFRKVVMFSH